MNDREYEAMLERVRAAQVKQQPEATDEPQPEEMDLADLGARMHGRPYKGDPLAEITDRMFRH